MQVALAQHDSAAAKAELERLRELFVRVDADRALRICKGLEMALNAGEWGLFSRALPLLKSEVHALLTRLTQCCDDTCHRARSVHSMTGSLRSMARNYPLVPCLPAWLVNLWPS